MWTWTHLVWCISGCAQSSWGCCVPYVRCGSSWKPARACPSCSACSTPNTSSCSGAWPGFWCSFVRTLTPAPRSVPGAGCSSCCAYSTCRSTAAGTCEEWEHFLPNGIALLEVLLKTLQAWLHKVHPSLAFCFFFFFCFYRFQTNQNLHMRKIYLIKNQICLKIKQTTEK